MNSIIIILALILFVLLCKAPKNKLQNQYEPLTENRIRNSRCKLFDYINKVENELINPSYNDLEYIGVVEQALDTLEKARVVITKPDYQCSARFISELEEAFNLIDDLLTTGKSRARELK